MSKYSLAILAFLITGNAKCGSRNLGLSVPIALFPHQSIKVEHRKTQNMCFHKQVYTKGPSPLSIMGQSISCIWKDKFGEEEQ